jgi:hypothetical protein
MEQELFFTGYCRCLDSSRTVEVIVTDGTVEADCSYENCVHRSVCPIAKEIDEKKKC